MFEALLLLVLVAGVVVLSRRWPDVEKRLFPDQVMKSTKESDQPQATSTAEPPATEGAKGFMRKPITTEPEVEAGAPSESTVVKETVTIEDTVEVETPSGDTVRETVKEEIVREPEPVTQQPGGLVSGTPARPSQPAYFDSTRASSESIDDLTDEADKAYRDRDYVRAERAALKIVMQQPKNHKYMTRLGQIYKETGSLEDARDAFAEAKKLDPKNFFVLNQLSEVERMISDKGGRTKAKS